MKVNEMPLIKGKTWLLFFGYTITALILTILSIKHQSYIYLETQIELGNVYIAVWGWPIYFIQDSINASPFGIRTLDDQFIFINFLLDFSLMLFLIYGIKQFLIKFITSLK